MKLHNGIGPNPRVVQIFLAEKGLNVPLVPVDLLGGENRREPYLSKNPAGQLPCLELDDGRFLSEITEKLLALADWYGRAAARESVAKSV